MEGFFGFVLWRDRVAFLAIALCLLVAGWTQSVTAANFTPEQQNAINRANAQIAAEQQAIPLLILPGVRPSLRCRVSNVGSSTQDGDAIKTENTPYTLELFYDSIDVEKGTARLINSVGRGTLQY
jgi:hypothetical protein